MDFELADQITKKCLNLYEMLPKKGKPVPDREWTLLSAIIMALDNKHSVVAMATGTKCLGKNRMSSRGDLVNDSHAEVLTRRCFLRYIYDQISQFKSTGSSKLIIGATVNGQFEINPEIRFYFYTSHVPCGDASIIPKSGTKGEKRKIETSEIERQKRKRLESGEENVEKLNLRSKAYLEDNFKGFDDEAKSSCITTADEGVVESPCKKKYFFDKYLGNHSNKSADSDDKFKQLNKSAESDDTFKQSNKSAESDDTFKQSNKSAESDDTFKQSNKSAESDDTLKQSNKSAESDDTFKQSNKSAESDDTFKQSNKSFYVEYENNEALSDCCGEVIDIHRTGAKSLAGEDSKLPGVLYHSLGAVRTKPGRGDPTLSVSCSDKMARWIACGLQGAMLSHLLSRPVLLDSVIVGAGGQYSHTALHRAIVLRTKTEHCPRLLQSTIVFPHSRYSTDPAARPCSSAILWSDVAYKPLEVGVEGKRQGATKKCPNGGLLMVCKQELLKSFLSLSGDRFHGMTYRSIKESALQYQNTWMKVKDSLGVWTTKPLNHENFIVS